ncbi:S41 family peptidase [Vibrio ulleungensis]|uniref:Tail specific protease domain-containing protein n=1 Tax=Vibrio ulleungensis TaxID=2807619 RepID=A0ABS2HAW9_9VIBR|nr:S41 family peptidase [Vibrio ulleungensis]MBM7034775.1 hypothetical protein [Vibrio ulleungensis]
MDDLTLEDKIYGLSEFWKTACYNFVYFDKIPDLNFDDAYRSYIPKVIATTDTYSYYRLLQQFCALLKDGHTNVFLPEKLQRDFLGQPPLTLIEHCNNAVIVAVAEKIANDIPVGSVIKTINDRPVDDYIAKYVMPYISASTEHVRVSESYAKALQGLVDTEVEFEVLTPTNMFRKCKLKRQPLGPQQAYQRLSLPSGGESRFKLQKLDSDILYIALNSFEDKSILDDFERSFPTIKQSKGLILDLRFNGGGSTTIGNTILSHLIDKPVQGASTQSRQHIGNMSAYAQIMEHVDLNLLDSDSLAMLEKISQSPQYNKWTSSDGDWLEPAEDTKTDIPIYVLIGHNTASAAEDFLVQLRSIDYIKTVGSPSFGSTGQPLFGQLPGGGSFRVCTLRNTYPDGTEFNGVGIQPDLPFLPTLSQFLSGQDHTLLFALEAIRCELAST